MENGSTGIAEGMNGGKGGMGEGKSTAKESRGMRAIPRNDVEGEFLLDLLESGEDCDLRR